MIDYAEWVEQHKSFDICNGCKQKTRKTITFRSWKDYALCEECWDKKVDYIKRVLG